LRGADTLSQEADIVCAAYNGIRKYPWAQPTYYLPKTVSGSLSRIED